MTTQRLTDQEVRHVAKLGRLKMSDEQVHYFAEQLSHVLGHFQKINELNIDDVEPMAHATDLTNVFRPDEPSTPLTVEQALANAPQTLPPFFKVPKVLGEGSGA